MLGVDTVLHGNEIIGEYRESSHVWLPSKLPFRDRAYIRYTPCSAISYVWLTSELPFRDRAYIRYTHAAPFHTSGFHLKYHLDIEPT